MTIRQVSAAGRAMIESFEGLRLTAYQDSAGVWTIGFGHVPSFKGQTITQQQAADLLTSDLAIAEMTVSTVAAQATDDQFAAMCSLAFNIGSTAFRSSTVLREHRLGNYQAAAQAFLLWDKVTIDGKLVTVNGLLTRREQEQALYLTPVPVSRFDV